MDEEEATCASSSSLTFPVLSGSDLERVTQTILHLFSPTTSSQPDLATTLQHELQTIQASIEAWGLIAGLAGQEDPNVRFFSAHTAQVKISRDWETLPRQLQPALLALLLQTISDAVSPSNPRSHQPENAVVVRKLFGCLASLLLRLPFHLFPHPIITVLQTLSQSAAAAQSLPSSGYSTPGAPVGGGDDERRGAFKMRLWGLEWCSICVEEIGRAGISEQKRQAGSYIAKTLLIEPRNALRRHLDQDLPAVMEAITRSMQPHLHTSMGGQEEALKEAEAACRCAESWIQYGLGGDELIALLHPLYNLLPTAPASSALVEMLSESVFKFGKGTRVLTEPLLAWITGSPGQSLLVSTEGEPSDEIIGFAKLLCALIEHSSEWLVARLAQTDVQALLEIILRLTGWQGIGGVDERVSELTLPIYPLLQEALMDSDVFQAPHEMSPDWAIAESFFRELVGVIRAKVRWPGSGEATGMDKEDTEAFESWRRDAGEVIVGAYYILREELFRTLIELVLQHVQGNTPWQDVEAALHCFRYSSEAVPLGEGTSLPILFGDLVLGQLSHRPIQGQGERRLRLTVVCMIQAYEEWFKFHPDHLLPILSYLVPSLTGSGAISRSAADALKALCDICRNQLVQHIGAFSELHGRIGDLGVEEQTKVIQAITSVIQALSPGEAIGPVEGILGPIVDRLDQAVVACQFDPSNAQAMLVQAINALTACFKGLSPSDNDIFDLADMEDDGSDKQDAVDAIRRDALMIALRTRIERSVAGVVRVWSGDGEVADVSKDERIPGQADTIQAISSLVKHSTLSSSDTLISLSPLPLLTLVCGAAERFPSALWMYLASTLTSRISVPPSPLTRNKDRTPDEATQHSVEEEERWNVIADAAGRLVVVASGMLGGIGVRDHPDLVEGWFKFCSALASRFPGILLRLPAQLVEEYIQLALLGLGAQERFSLKSANEFLVALLATSRFPSPLEPLADSLIKHFGPQILRAILLSAGSEGPRSVIPNLAELLASFVQRVKGEEMGNWLNVILGEEGFPDNRATGEAKARLKTVVLKSRTTKNMREALHEFALVSRGLDNTTYGNATAI